MRTRVRARGLAALAAVVLALAALQASGVATAPAGTARGERAAAMTWFGYNEHWFAKPGWIDTVGGAGANALRAVMSWRVVERNEGQLNWRQYDELYARMLANGARPLWVLSDAPCWAWAPSKRRCRELGRISYPPRPEFDPEWTRFAYQVAQRYPESVAIETWNEPNLAAFYKPEPDPERAAELAALVNLGVDQANPQIPVVFAGPSPTFVTVPGQEIAYEDFLRRAYTAVGPGHWDGLGMHPFPSMRKQGHYLRDIQNHLNIARDIIRDAGAPNTPIWVTEVGLSTGGIRPYSMKEQATGLRRVYRALARRRDIDVPAMIVHRVMDQANGHGAPAEAGWGVLRSNGRPKPALCELAKLRGRRC